MQATVGLVQNGKCMFFINLASLQLKNAAVMIRFSYSEVTPCVYTLLKKVQKCFRFFHFITHCMHLSSLSLVQFNETSFTYQQFQMWSLFRQR